MRQALIITTIVIAMAALFGITRIAKADSENYHVYYVNPIDGSYVEIHNTSHNIETDNFGNEWGVLLLVTNTDTINGVWIDTAITSTFEATSGGNCNAGPDEAVCVNSAPNQDMFVLIRWDADSITNTIDLHWMIGAGDGSVEVTGTLHMVAPDPIDTNIFKTPDNSQVGLSFERNGIFTETTTVDILPDTVVNWVYNENCVPFTGSVSEFNPITCTVPEGENLTVYVENDWGLTCRQFEVYVPANDKAETKGACNFEMILGN